MVEFRSRTCPEGLKFMSFRTRPNKRNWIVSPSICLWAVTLIWLVPAAQGQASEWLTSSGNAARDAWQRVGSKITTKNVGKLQLLWKTKVTAKTVGMQSFREPLIVT